MEARAAMMADMGMPGMEMGTQAAAVVGWGWGQGRGWGWDWG